MQKKSKILYKTQIKTREFYINLHENGVDEAYIQEQVAKLEQINQRRVKTIWTFKPLSNEQMRKESEKKTFVNIKNVNDYPKFVIGENQFWTIWGIVKWVSTEKKQITPKTWPNAWKEITVKNLIVEIVDEQGEMELQIPLYSAIARNVINCLAWPDELDEVYFSVYLNKAGFRSIAIKKKDSKDIADFYKPFYTREQERDMVEMRIEQWEEKKDYDKLTSFYVEKLLPKIQEKIDGRVEEKKEEPALPF